jgi:protein O-GlcNAc transferase
MATIPEALAIALQYHQAGRLQEAEQLYRQILAADPQHADAWHALGVLAHHTGQPLTAAEYIARSIGLNPNVAERHRNLGLTLQALGRFEEAVGCFRTALKLDPSLAETHVSLGHVLQAMGKWDESAESYRLALGVKPDCAEAYNGLGNALVDQQGLEEAVACYRKALQLNPDLSEAYNNLALALHQQEKLDEAIEYYRQALRFMPHRAEVHFSLGEALLQSGKLDEAEECCRKALQLKPDFSEAYNNLGSVLSKRGNRPAAVECFARAVQFKPNNVPALVNLAWALQEQGKLEEALACYRQALRLMPDLAKTHFDMGDALWQLGDLDEAVACYRRALELKPDMAQASNGLLFALRYRVDVTPGELADAHAEYERQYAAPLRETWRPHENTRDPKRRLRVGFVSADFGRHPVGDFLIRVLENLDPSEVEVFCYSDRVQHDERTVRFQATAREWRDVCDWSNERLAEQIRADQIDILFDLAGNTGHLNRPLLFARKPAPIQIAWIGCEGTTGLSAMDYILADRYEIPPEAESYYREQVLRMPDGFGCYEPLSDAPAVSPLPALERHYVRFGCFNNPAKINARVIEVWAKILRRLPEARLALKYRGMNNPSITRRFKEGFGAQGVDDCRIDFWGDSPYGEHLNDYQNIDVALDPFPFSGGATTCEALWMGAPVVTCPGETFASRHTLSHLSNVGLTETIARDLDEYVDVAVNLAGDLPRLADIRSRLRGQMAASSLCDGPRFAENFMALLRDVWRKYALTLTS